MILLSERAHGHDNNFQLVRLLAAAAVVYFHSYALTDRWVEEPLWKIAPELNFGALGVMCFFVVSGFLVTQSWLARRRVLPFIVARILRIYPALFAATLVTIVLAGLSSTLQWPSCLTHPQTLDYAWRVALGWEMVYRLPGAFPTNPLPHDVNGSLWTLPVELRLYVAVLLAGLAGLLARRWLLLALVSAATALFTVRPDWFPMSTNDRVVRELALLFALGVARVHLARKAAALAASGGSMRGTHCMEPLWHAAWFLHGTHIGVRAAGDRIPSSRLSP